MNAQHKKEFDAGTLLQELRSARVILSIEGDQLRVRAPSGTLTDTLKDRLRTHRDALVQHLKSAGAATDVAPATTPPQRAREGIFPLSFAQQRLWFLERVNTGSNAYVIGGAVRILGAFDPDLLFESCRELVRRHEGLRTRFGEKAGEPFAEVLKELPPALDLVEVAGVAEQDRMARAKMLVSEKMGESFDLHAGPLFAVTIYRFAPDDHVVLTRVHHIVSDGWSLAVISRELLTIYDALSQGLSDPLPPVEAHCVDHSLWERDRAASGKWRRDIDYWCKELADVPALTELPVDRPHPNRPSYRGARFAAQLDQGSADAEGLGPADDRRGGRSSS